MIEGSGSIPLTNGSGREAQKHVDPDPELEPAGPEALPGSRLI